jgi:hypothetical protein
MELSRGQCLELLERDIVGRIVFDTPMGPG